MSGEMSCQEKAETVKRRGWGAAAAAAPAVGRGGEGVGLDRYSGTSVVRNLQFEEDTSSGENRFLLEEEQHQQKMF